MEAAIAPDGSPVAVYLAVPAEPAFTAVLDHLDPAGSVLDLGCGVGRLTNLLARPGREVWGVDESPAMLAHLSPDATAVEADIVGLDLGRGFDAVVLASHLVNEADRARREAYLRAVADHLGADGVAYVQRHDPRAERYRGTVTQVVATPAGPLTLRLAVHELDGQRLRATSTMELGEHRWSQTFTHDLLDDDGVDASLRTVGLRLDEVLDPTWVTARQAEPG